MQETMLTTVDNPFNPFTEYDSWYAYDQRMGYHTPELLDRIMKNSDELSDPDHSFVIEKAIEEIVRENVSGKHRRVNEQGEPVTSLATA